MDVLVDNGRSEIDANKRERLYHQIVDTTLEECPIIYHCNVNFVQIYDQRIKGFNPAPQEFMELQDETFWAA